MALGDSTRKINSEGTELWITETYTLDFFMKLLYWINIYCYINYLKINEDVWYICFLFYNRCFNRKVWPWCQEMWNLCMVSSGKWDHQSVWTFFHFYISNLNVFSFSFLLRQGGMYVLSWYATIIASIYFCRSILTSKIYYVTK